MTENNVARVKAVFEAIRAQDAERAVKYVDPSLVQHYPYMAAGLEGFRAYIIGSAKEQLQLRLARTLADGPFVVAQVMSEAPGETMFAVYRFENELIVEHWAFSSPAAPPNPSGHTQLDGPAEANDLENTEKNKALVRRYYETFHIAGDRSRNDEFFGGDVMIRHEPGVRDGVGEFLRDVEVLMQHRTINEIRLLIGEGDLVFIGAKGTHEGNACVYIDLYRVANDKLVEHWGFPEMVPPPAQRKHSNEML